MSWKNNSQAPGRRQIETGIVYILLIGSGQGKILSREEIDATGKSLLTEEEIEILLKEVI